MKQLFFALVFVALPGNGPQAQQDAQQPKADLPKGQMPDLGRPTDKDDPLPLFDYETYFTGTWKFEWIVPDSPFGPGGIIQGTEVFHPGEDGKFFKSDVEGSGPSGAFTASLLTVPVYSFEWQLYYELTEPLHIPAGSKLTATAHYDNSLYNPYNPGPHLEVYWAEQSWDEMFSPQIRITIDSRNLLEMETDSDQP